MMSGETKTHFEWVDRWKGILILLVVLGHVVGGGFHLAPKGLGHAFCYHAYQVIYSFHMPAFFMLAGLVWVPRPDERFSTFFLRRVRRLLVPYFVFGIFSVVVYLLLESSFQSARQGMASGYYAAMGIQSWIQPFLSLLHAGGWPKGEGFRANGVLWFLPCFLMTQLAFWWLDRALRRIPVWGVWVVVFMCLGLGCLCRIYSLQYLPWCVGRVPYYLVYMLVGHWGLPPLLASCKSARAKVWWPYALGGLTLLFVSGVSCLPDLFRAFVSSGWYLVYSVVAVVGCVLSLFWGQVVQRRLWMRLGLHSLGIMLVHKYFIVALQMKVGFIRGIFAGGLLQVLGGCIVVTSLALGGAYVISVILTNWVPWLWGTSKTREG